MYAFEGSISTSGVSSKSWDGLVVPGLFPVFRTTPSRSIAAI
jgi:hypothetical protein